MFDLPPELTLDILAYLPIDCIAKLPRVCRYWKSFVETNENVIFHNASAWHGYIPSTALSLEDGYALYSERAVGRVENWRTFCKKRNYIEKSWSGKAPSTITPHYGTGETVHRFQIDEKAGYIISTSMNGGIYVDDLKADELLWSLPLNYTRAFAHCEYGDGYLVFDHMSGTKEVWRRSTDCTDEEADQVMLESRPAPRQLAASADAMRRYSPDQTNLPNLRGHFRPWALLKPADVTRAFRLAHGVLGCASWDTVYIWDLRTGALIQKIDQIQQLDGFGLGDICYIEVNEKYIIVCGRLAMRVYERGQSGTGSQKGDPKLTENTTVGGFGRCVLELSPSMEARWQMYTACDETPCTDTSEVLQALKVHTVTDDTSIGIVDRREHEFLAVHVSSCGSHIAILTRGSRVILIPNFKDLFFGQSSTTFTERAIVINIEGNFEEDTSRYLAFKNGRVAAATKLGVFIFELDWFHPIFGTPLAPRDTAPPKINACRVGALYDFDCLDTLSCMQMTDTGLFVNWSPNRISHLTASSEELDEIHWTVVSVDFMEPERESSVS